jgi:hypothetical protein
LSYYLLIVKLLQFNIHDHYAYIKRLNHTTRSLQVAQSVNQFLNYMNNSYQLRSKKKSKQPLLVLSTPPKKSKSSVKVTQFNSLSIMSTHQKSNLKRFSDLDGDIPFEQWITLFEFATRAITKDDDRLEALMGLLDGPALQYFAMAIIPHISKITYKEAAALMLKRFESNLVPPIIKASERTLRKNESVRKYYDEKVLLLRQTKMDDINITAAITQGMPQSHRQTLLSAQLNTPEEWLRVASRIEADVGSHSTGYKK